jgi:hypothetical protein
MQSINFKPYTSPKFAAGKAGNKDKKSQPNPPYSQLPSFDSSTQSTKASTDGLKANLKGAGKGIWDWLVNPNLPMNGTGGSGSWIGKK